MSVSLGKLFRIGCADNSCVWGPRGGMGTNGGCRCLKDLPREPDLRQWAMETQRGIRLLRELAELPHVNHALVELAKRIREQERELLAMEAKP